MTDECVICSTLRSNCVFQACGHEMCHACLVQLPSHRRICHICRAPIATRPTLRIASCDGGVGEATRALDTLFPPAPRAAPPYTREDIRGRIYDGGWSSRWAENELPNHPYDGGGWTVMPDAAPVAPVAPVAPALPAGTMTVVEVENLAAKQVHFEWRRQSVAFYRGVDFDGVRGDARFRQDHYPLSESVEFHPLLATCHIRLIDPTLSRPRDESASFAYARVYVNIDAVVKSAVHRLETSLAMHQLDTVRTELRDDGRSLAVHESVARVGGAKTVLACHGVERNNATRRRDLTLRWHVMFSE